MQLQKCEDLLLFLSIILTILNVFNNFEVGTIVCTKQTLRRFHFNFFITVIPFILQSKQSIN